VFGHLDGLTLFLVALKSSLTLPAIPKGTVGEKGVFGHVIDIRINKAILSAKKGEL